MELRYCYVLLLQVMVLSYHGARGQHPEFSTVPANTTAKVGFTARLDCQPVDDSSITRWLVNGLGPIGTTNIDSLCAGCILLNRSLYIPSVRTTHAAEYTCIILPLTANNFISAYLTVAESPKISPAGSNMQFEQGGTLQINVNITGVPQPNVTWTFNEQYLTDPRATITNTRLTITNVRQNDSGMYRVTAQNCADTKTEDFIVIINFRPVVTLTRIPDRENVGVGGIVNLTCSIVSYPQSNVNFQQKNSDNVIERNYTQNVMHTQSTYQVISTSRLQFDFNDLTGTNEFCCQAANNFGAASHCLSFRKSGTPEPPILQASSSSPTSVLVSWSMLTSVTYQLRYRMQGLMTVWITVDNDIPSTETSRRVNDLMPNTVYEFEIRATATDNDLQSPANITSAITRPAEIEGFMLDSVTVKGRFDLSWQAPSGLPLNNYTVQITVLGNTTNLTLPGTSTTWTFPNPISNTAYRFTVQAINDGGPGPMSGVMIGFFCDAPSITGVRPLIQGASFLNITWTVDNPRLGLQLNGTVFMVEETGNSQEVFTSELVAAGNEHQCISDLQPGTLYTLKIVAVYACENTSYTANFRTAPGAVDNVVPSDGCLVYRPVLIEPIAESESSNLEGWQIALIIVVPLVAVVTMLSIGIYCACRRKSHSELEMGAVPNMNNKDYVSTHVHHNHARNNSSSSTSVTGTSYRSESVTPLTPTRSNLPYSTSNRSPTWNPPVDMARLQEQTTGTSV